MTGWPTPTPDSYEGRRTALMFINDGQFVGQLWWENHERQWTDRFGETHKEAVKVLYQWTGEVWLPMLTYHGDGKMSPWKEE